MGRIEAHLLVACLSDTLHVCLRQRLKLVAGGPTPRAVLEKFCAVQVMDVPLPTTDGRTVSLTRHTQPEQELQVLLTQLNLTRPTQPLPKITVAAPAVEWRLRGHLIRKPQQISLPPFPIRQVGLDGELQVSARSEPGDRRPQSIGFERFDDEGINPTQGTVRTRQFSRKGGNHHDGLFG